MQTRQAYKTLDQNGRELGPRALQTRKRLLQATHELLDRQSVRDASVVEIARRAGTSPATFYQYFKDVSEATLRLAEEAAAETPALVELIDRPWRGQKGLGTARDIVSAFVQAQSRSGFAGKVITADGNQLAPAQYASDVRVSTPSIDDGSYLPTLLDLCEEHQVKAVVPLTDLDIELLAASSEQFATIGATVFVPTPR